MAELPDLEADRRAKEDQERRGAGAAWSGASPASGTTLATGQGAQGAAAARSAGLGARLVGGAARSFSRSFIEAPLAFARQMIALGPRAAMKPLALAALRGAALLGACYAAGEIIDWAVWRLYPRSERTIRGAAFAGAGPASGSLPRGALPAEGLFGALPGVFTTHKGFLEDGSPAPDASILKEGKPAPAAASAAGGAGAAEPGAEPAARDREADAWAEALAQAQGEEGGSAGLRKLPGLGAGTFSSGAGGGRGAPGGAGARGGGGSAGAATPGPAAGGGQLTRFRAAAARRALVQGNRSSRLVPPGVNERQKLVGTTIVSNEAVGIGGREASFVTASAPFDQNNVGAQAIPDPIGLAGGAPTGGPGGGPGAPRGVRPRPSTNTGGNPTPFDPNDGNRDILRPDLGGIDDVVENNPNRPPPGKNDSLYLALVEDARALTESARDKKSRGDQKQAWADYMWPIACVIAGSMTCGLVYAAYRAAKALFREARAEADQAQLVSDEIERGYGQHENAEAIDYCIQQARIGRACEFRGDWTRAQTCGYKPQMKYTELQAFSRCMGENGAGLQWPNSWIPEGRIDPRDRDRVCRAIYPDAVLVDTGNAREPYRCVRGSRPPP